jgi:hypothetical protein
MDNVRLPHIRCYITTLELGADSGGLEAYANCYVPETGQGPSLGFGWLLPTDKSLIVYPQVVRKNASSETWAMGWEVRDIMRDPAWL